MVAPVGAAFLRVSYQTKDINITKVEQGNKATDWSPSPEDVDAAINNVKTSVTDITSDGKVTPNEKRDLLRVKDEIVSTHTELLKSVATVPGATTPSTYTTSYSNVTTRLTNAAASPTVTTDIIAVDRTNLTTALSTYFTERAKLNDLVVTKSKEYTESQASKATTDAINDAKTKDTRSVNSTPTDYQRDYPYKTVKEFKTKSVIGLTEGAGTYCYLETQVKYSDASGGRITQTAYTDDSRIFTRNGAGTAWTAWVESETTTGALTKAGQALTDAKLYADTKASDAVKEIVGDNKITPNEKRELLRVNDEIVSTHTELLKSVATVPDAATPSTYTTAYSNVTTRLTNAAASPTTITNIIAADRTNLTKALSDYFTERAKLNDLLVTKSKAYTESQANTSLSSAKLYADGLDTYIKGAFKNGIIEQAEAKAIRTHIAQLTSEKDEISQKYTTIYANTNLLGTAKTNLASANTAYNTAHKSLVDYINSSISNGLVTAAQAAVIDTRFTTYQEALKTLTVRFEEATSSIINKAESNATTAANNYADLNDKIIVIDSKTKKFLNPSSYSSDAASHTGYLIIETPIQSGRMVTIDITGYNYQANKASLALSVSFYITGTSFVNFDYVDTGTYPIENIRLGLKGGKVVIIIGNATSTWSYPKIDVTQAIIGYTASPDTYKDGWVTRISNVITDITNVIVMNNIYSTSLKGIYTNVYYPATTEIHGGNIRTKTIAADSIVANSITAGQIAGNTITATQMTTDSITARELKAGTVAATHIVGNTITGDKLVVDAINTREIKAGAVTAAQINVTNLSAINSNLGTITGGSMTIGTNFGVTSAGILTAKSGTFSGDITGASGRFTGTVLANSIEGKVANIADLAVTQAEIANATITGAKIADLAVDTLQIAGNAVTIPRFIEIANFPQTTSSSIRASTGLIFASTTFDAQGGYISIDFFINVFSLFITQTTARFTRFMIYEGSTELGSFNTDGIGGRISNQVYTAENMTGRKMYYLPPDGLRTYTLRVKEITTLSQNSHFSATGISFLITGVKK